MTSSSYYPECRCVGLNYPKQNLLIYQAGGDPAAFNLLPNVWSESSGDREVSSLTVSSDSTMSSDMRWSQLTPNPRRFPTSVMYAQVKTKEDLL